MAHSTCSAERPPIEQDCSPRSDSKISVQERYSAIAIIIWAGCRPSEIGQPTTITESVDL